LPSDTIGAPGRAFFLEGNMLGEAPKKLSGLFSTRQKKNGSDLIVKVKRLGQGKTAGNRIGKKEPSAPSPYSSIGCYRGGQARRERFPSRRANKSPVKKKRYKKNSEISSIDELKAERRQVDGRKFPNQNLYPALPKGRKNRSPRCSEPTIGATFRRYSCKDLWAQNFSKTTARN